MSFLPTGPRALRDPKTLQVRRQLLDPSRPLFRYAESLRRPNAEVPDFDPLNGNEEARLLFLLEKPGPMTDPRRPGRSGSGFVSSDNDDATAEAIFGFLSQAKVERKRIAIWNLIPWWNGTIRITSAERIAGLAEAERLTSLLPILRGVVLVGRKAGLAENHLKKMGLQTFLSAHPSPKVRATNRTLWDAIPGVWATAARACDATVE